MPDWFGKSITREFYALEDNEYISLPSQAPAIYLFGSQPSLTDARAGTNAVQTIAYWSEVLAAPYKRAYTYTPIDDATPTATERTKEYWEAINFVASSGQKLTVVRSLTLERPESHDTIVPTSIDDVTALFVPITTYYNDGQIETFIGLAVDHFKLDLKARDIDFGRVQQLSEVRIPIAYKALAIALRGQIRRDPTFAELVDQFESEYSTRIAQIKLPYDEEVTGELTETGLEQTVRIIR
jgi:hypothetical protein